MFDVFKETMRTALFLFEVAKLGTPHKFTSTHSRTQHKIHVFNYKSNFWYTFLVLVLDLVSFSVTYLFKKITKNRQLKR